MSRKPLALLAALGLTIASCGDSSGDIATEVTDATVAADDTQSDASTDESDGSGGADGEGSGGLSSSSASGSSGGDSSSSDSGSGDSGSGDSEGGSSGGGQIGSEVSEQVLLTLDDAFPPEVETCLLAEIVQDEKLLDAMASGSDFEDLDDVEQARVASLAINCAEPGVLGDYMVQGFNEGSDFDAPPELGVCLEDRLRGPEGELVILGLIAVGDDVAPPEAARQPLIDTLVECIPGSLFGEMITQEIADDPSMEDAIDSSCVEAGYDEPGVLESFWTAFVDNPDADFEDLPPEVQADFMGPMLDCVSFSSLIAAEAEADGVTLSQATLDCIDEKIAESGMMEDLMAGIEPDEAVLGGAILGCLSAEELEQMTNS